MIFIFLYIFYYVVAYLSQLKMTCLIKVKVNCGITALSF